MGKRGGEPDLPEFILVKKFYPNRRDKQKQMKRIWELRSLAQSGANMTTMDTEDRDSAKGRRKKVRGSYCCSLQYFRIFSRTNIIHAFCTKPLQAEKTASRAVSVMF